MRRTGELLWNVTGQSLILRVKQGRPTSAAYQVFRNYADDDSTPEWSGNATVESVNTTISVASGQAQSDPRKLSLTSTATIQVGRKYLVSESSLQEWVEPVEIQPTFIRVRHPLENDYTTAAAFASTYLSAAVDATWIADKNHLSDIDDQMVDYRVKWSIVVGGATVVAYSFFDVLRQLVLHDVDIADVNDRAPGLHDSMPIEYRPDQGRSLIETSFRAVMAHFAALRIDVHAVRDDFVLDELVLLRTLRVLAEGGWHPKNIDIGSYVQLTTGNYDRFFEQHFVILKHDLQTSITAAAAQNTTSRDRGREATWSK